MKKLTKNLLKAFDNFKLSSKNQKTICGGYDTNTDIYGSQMTFRNTTSTGMYMVTITTAPNGDMTTSTYNMIGRSMTNLPAEDQ